MSLGTIIPLESLLRRSVRAQLARRKAEAAELFADADALQADAEALQSAADVKYAAAGRAQAEVEELTQKLEPIR